MIDKENILLNSNKVGDPKKKQLRRLKASKNKKSLPPICDF